MKILTFVLLLILAYLTYNNYRRYNSTNFKLHEIIPYPLNNFFEPREEKDRLTEIFTIGAIILIIKFFILYLIDLLWGMLEIHIIHKIIRL